MAHRPPPTPYLDAATVEGWLRALRGTSGRRPLPDLTGATLLMVDLQEIFLGEGSPAWLPSVPAASRGWAALLEAFRRRRSEQEVPARVVWTLHQNPHGDEGGIATFLGGRPLRPDDPLAAPGIEPAPGEEVIPKTRYSAWRGTRLARLIPPGGVVVLAGVTTHRCVLATAIEAASMDRIPVVVADATATWTPAQHLASLQVVAGGHGLVATVAEVLSAMERR